jgi:hypothetical protein
MTGREVAGRQRPMRVALRADDGPSLAALRDMGQDGQFRVSAERAASQIDWVHAPRIAVGCRWARLWTASSSMAGRTTFILAGWTGMNVVG